MDETTYYHVFSRFEARPIDDPILEMFFMEVEPFLNDLFDGPNGIEYADVFSTIVMNNDILQIDIKKVEQMLTVVTKYFAGKVILFSIYDGKVIGYRLNGHGGLKRLNYGITSQQIIAESC